MDGVFDRNWVLYNKLQLTFFLKDFINQKTSPEVANILQQYNKYDGAGEDHQMAEFRK